MNIIKNVTAGFLMVVFLVTPFFVNFSLVSAKSLDKEYSDGLEKTEYNKSGNTTVQDIIVKVISWLLRILAALAVMVLIIAGMMYILSGGDEGKASTAKTWILYAIIGLIIALLGWVIVNLATQLVKTGS